MLSSLSFTVVGDTREAALDNNVQAAVIGVGTGDAGIAQAVAAYRCTRLASLLEWQYAEQ